MLAAVRLTDVQKATDSSRDVALSSIARYKPTGAPQGHLEHIIEHCNRTKDKHHLPLKSYIHCLGFEMVVKAGR